MADTRFGSLFKVQQPGHLLLELGQGQRLGKADISTVVLHLLEFLFVQVGGQDDDLRFLGILVGFYLAADFVALDVRHHDVQDHQVRVEVVDLKAGLESVRRTDYLVVEVVFLQGLDDGFDDDGVIVDHKDAFAFIPGFGLRDGDALAAHEPFHVVSFDSAVTANGFVSLDVSGLDPVDDGFRGDIAELAGLEDGECILHCPIPPSIECWLQRGLDLLRLHRSAWY
jgi:hypothetical protein